MFLFCGFGLCLYWLLIDWFGVFGMIHKKGFFSWFFTWSIPRAKGMIFTPAACQPDRSCKASKQTRTQAKPTAQHK
jgi:hypothetical protein